MTTPALFDDAGTWNHQVKAVAYPRYTQLLRQGLGIPAETYDKITIEMWGWSCSCGLASDPATFLASHQPSAVQSGQKHFVD